MRAGCKPRVRRDFATHRYRQLATPRRSDFPIDTLGAGQARAQRRTRKRLAKGAGITERWPAGLKPPVGRPAGKSQGGTKFLLASHALREYK
jgi:hypothetical protein